jgi:glutamine cyclotransferase
MSRSIEVATAATTVIDESFSSSSSATSRDNNNMTMSSSRVSRKTTQQNDNHKSIGRTAFILAIVILPTAMLICLGYFVYTYFGDGRNNIMLLGGVEDNLEEGSVDNETTISFNNTNHIIEETQQAGVSSPINKKISTAYTAYEQVPHDISSFTQGLTYGTDGYLYETTGLRGQSKLNKIDPNTFQVIKSIHLDDIYFGEGSTYYTDNDGNGRLILLTYTKQTAFIYDPTTLTLLHTFQYTTTPPKNEGWGITYDPTEHEFIVSDGTSTLYIWDSTTYQEKRQIQQVTRFDTTPQYHLNELEFINDLICCNIWYQDEIICVDKVTGRSVREYDLSELYPMEERGGYHNTMNGMALGTDHVLITGKRWDRMFKVRFDDWDTMFSR